MNFIEVFAEPFISVPLSAAITVVFQRVKSKVYDKKHLKKIFGFTNSDTTVYLPLATVDGGIGAYSGHGDLLALSRLLAVVENNINKADRIKISPSQSPLKEDFEKNIIVIGGGKYNKVYLDLIQELNPPIHFWDTAQISNYILKNKDGSQAFAPVKSALGEVEYDVGLVLLAPNPFNPSRSIIMACGAHSYGSAAAMSFLCDRAAVQSMLRSKSKRVMCVVGGKVVNHNIAQVKRLSEVIEW